LYVQHDIVCNYCFKLTEKVSVGNFKVDKSENACTEKKLGTFLGFLTRHVKKTKNVASSGF